MTLDIEHVNYWAVLAAGLGTFFLGALWYTALFGKRWAELNGYVGEKLKEMKGKVPPPVFFSVMLVSYLGLALVVALLVAGAGITTAAGGAVLGLLLWLGPAAAIGLTHYISSDRPAGVYAIDLGYQLVYLVMMAAILGGWR